MSILLEEMRTAGMLLVAVAVLAPSLARGQDSRPTEELEELMRGLRYEAAISRADAIWSTPSVAAPERLRALELSAVASLALGDDPQAVERFRRLLDADPEARLTDGHASPRVSEVFERARRERTAGPVGRLELTLHRSLGSTSARAITRPVGENALVRVVLVRRGGGATTEIEAALDGSAWTATVPLGSRDDGETFSLRAEGYAPSGAVASVSEAQTVRPTPPPGERPANRPRRRPREPEGSGGWLLAGIGTAVVVTTLVVLLVLASGGSSSTSP